MNAEVEWNKRYPWSTGYDPSNTAQDAVALFCCQGTLWAHVKFTMCQDLQGLFYRVSLQSEILKNVASSHMKVFASVRVEEDLRPIPPDYMGLTEWQLWP